jgi:hypothetical protein
MGGKNQQKNVEKKTEGSRGGVAKKKNKKKKKLVNRRVWLALRILERKVGWRIACLLAAGLVSDSTAS